MVTKKEKNPVKKSVKRSIKKTTRKALAKKRSTRSYKKRTLQKVQRGGVPAGGISFENLPANILGLIEYTTDSIVDFIESTVYTLEIGSDMGTAFGPGEPNPNSVKIPGEVFS